MVDHVSANGGQMAWPGLPQSIQTRRREYRNLATAIGFGAHTVDEPAAGKPLNDASQPTDGDRDEVRQLAHP